MKCFSFTFALAAAFGVLVTINPIHAQDVPYNASGTDARFNPNTGTFSGPGNGTHVGNVSLEGVITAGPTPDLSDPDIFLKGPFNGTQTIIAANGDRIEWEFSGTVCLEWVQGGPSDPFAEPIVKGRWEITSDVVGGDGRFKNVSGTSLKGAAINPPFNPFAGEWPFDWFVNGTIDLGKKGKKK